MNFWLPVILLIIVSLTSCARKGCTDVLADNYDKKAKEDDESCIYSAPDDMINYFSFNNSFMMDERGNASLRMVGNAQSSTDRFGRLNSAILLGGEEDYFIIEDLPELAAALEFTISFWYYGYGQVDQQALYMFSTTSTSPSRKIELFTTGADFITNDFQDIRVRDAAGAINKWVHYTVTYSGEAAIIYINGEMSSQRVTGGLALPIEDEVMYVTQFFEGKIDELTFWSRPLTADEVMKVYLAE